jgi:hypothetical protein
MAESADRSAKSWRAKAERLRALAASAKAFALAGTSEVAAQGVMLDAARGYEQLADRAEKREAEMKSRSSN